MGTVEDRPDWVGDVQAETGRGGGGRGGQRAEIEIETNLRESSAEESWVP